MFPLSEIYVCGVKFLLPLLFPASPTVINASGEDLVMISTLGLRTYFSFIQTATLNLMRTVNLKIMPTLLLS